MKCSGSRRINEEKIVPQILPENPWSHEGAEFSELGPNLWVLLPKPIVIDLKLHRIKVKPQLQLKFIKL